MRLGGVGGSGVKGWWCRTWWCTMGLPPPSAQSSRRSFTNFVGAHPTPHCQADCRSSRASSRADIVLARGALFQNPTREGVNSSFATSDFVSVAGTSLKLDFRCEQQEITVNSIPMYKLCTPSERERRSSTH